MTEAEKKEIVALVMSEISGQAVDFDLQTVTPQRTDILPAVRPDGAGGYTGVTLDWGGITDELTTQAKEFRNEALQAKKDTELLKGETNGIKSEVNDIYTQFNQVVDSTIESVRNVYQSDLNAESTARQTADNTLQQNIDSEASTRAEADTALGARIDSETTTRESEVAELERVNAIQKYEIENLKAKAEGQIYRTEIVEGEAYSLDVPSSVAPYAELQKIGGKSVVWNQIYNASINKTSMGITIINNSGECTITGTATEIGNGPTFNFTEFKGAKGHKFWLKHNINLPDGFYIFDEYNNNSGVDITTIVFTQKSEYIIPQLKITSKDITINASGYLQLFDLTLMFGSGNEPTLEECKKIFSADYYPYDAGTLKSFPVQRVKSVGRNLFKPTLATTTQNGVTCRNNGDGTYTLNGTAESSVYFTIGTFTITKSGKYKRLGCPSNGSASKYYLGGGVIENDYGNGTIGDAEKKVIVSYVIAIAKGYTCNNLVFKPMLTTDLTATYDDFVPYRDPIDHDVSSLTTDLKSTPNAQDEWINGKKTQRVAEVDFSTLTWRYDEPHAFWCSSKALPNQKDGTYLFCETVPFGGMNYTGSNLGTLVNGTSNVWVRNGSSTQSPTGKALYELAEPTEETIPEIDNYIQVEGGGTLTFESDDTIHMPVPSTTRFVVDLT